MILVAVGLLIAFLVTFFLMPFIIKIAKENKLFDIPDERKTHTYPISSLGGVGIVAGLSLSLLLVADFTSEQYEFQYYLAAIFIIFITGVIDDIFVLIAWKKVIAQLLVAFILISKAHLLINNLGGLGGFFEINPFFSWFISIFVILLVINSFNLIDGVDGLASSLGLVSSLAFGLFFFFNHHIPYAILGFALSGTLLAFLLFNFPPAKIFMGDSGSMLIGLVNGILFLKFINVNNESGTSLIPASFTVGFGFLMVPLLDVLRVFIIRLTKGVSPFAPDRNHIHHLLLNKGFTHTTVTIILFLSAVAFAIISYALKGFNINLVAAILTAIFFSGVFVVKYFRSSKHLHVVSKETIQADTKILSMYKPKDDAAIKEE